MNYERLSCEDGALVLGVGLPPDQVRCPACGSTDVIGRGGKVRRLRAPGIGRKRVFIELTAPRVECHVCGVVRQVKLEFAGPKRRLTRALERYVLELSRLTTIEDVAQHLDLSWDTVKAIQAEHLRRRFGKPKLKRLTVLGIDEIAVGKGHSYLTLVLDMKSGAVVFVGDGKGADALGPFWKRLRASHAKIEAVAMDMSAAYIGAVREALPKAAIVFDRFHVMKLMNQAVDAVRRSLQNRQAEEAGRKTVKGCRWLLLKNLENLDKERDEQKRLQAVIEEHQPLCLAWLLKEELRLFWQQESREQAVAFLESWIGLAQASGIKPLSKMAETLLKHWDGLLTWYDHHISNGPLEGTNNKIQTMKRQAYGFRDREFYKLRILGIHEAKYALVG